MHYDVNAPNKPIGVQYVSPNNGPFHDLNPSYRVFYIDGDHPETTRVSCIFLKGGEERGRVLVREAREETEKGRREA